MLMDFIRKVVIFALVILALIIYIAIRPSLKRRKASRIAAEQQRERQENFKRQMELDRIEREQTFAEAKRIAEQRKSEILSAVASCPGSEKYQLAEQQTNVNIRTLNITEFSKVAPSRYVAFDLETTGLNPIGDSIVEIGAVLVENGQIIKEYSQLVDPGCPMPSDASAVNHITDDMLRCQPKIHQVLPSFLSFVGDDILAAHNASFDYKFLAQACMRCQFRLPVGFFDTMLLARYWPESEDKKLISLCDAADIDLSVSHRALDDARALVAFISASLSRRNESRKRNHE